jgi:hypothetical protein
MASPRSQRPFACKLVSVRNMSVTCQSTVNLVERQLPDQTNSHFRPEAEMASPRKLILGNDGLDIFLMLLEGEQKTGAMKSRYFVPWHTA